MNQNRINPVGLKGKEQLQHIQDLMHKLTPINESVRNSVVELTKKAADGKIYAIVRENHNYFIKIAAQKKGPLVTEDFQYIGGLQNKHDESYPTYAKALKRLNGKLIVVAESYGITSEINTFANEHLLNMEQENPVYEEEACDDEETVTEVVEELENEKEEDCDECGSTYQTESRSSSIAKAINEDDGGYCNMHVLPKGIEDVFESLDDIKKKK
jgi:hypothetical protein